MFAQSHIKLLPSTCIRLMLGVIAIALVSSCGPSVVGLRVDPSFTYPALQAGKIGVGGVVSLVPGTSDGDLIAWSNQFSSAIAEVRQNVEVEAPGIVANRSGDDLIKRADSEYRNGAVTPDTLRALREKNGSLAYLAFARMESNTTGKRQYEDSPLVGNQPTQLVSTSSRVIRVAVNVYDLKTGTSVWGASLAKGLANRNQVQKPSVLFSLIAAATSKSSSPSYPDYPETPETSAVLLSIFKGVGDNLPKP